MGAVQAECDGSVPLAKRRQSMVGKLVPAGSIWSHYIRQYRLVVYLGMNMETGTSTEGRLPFHQHLMQRKPSHQTKIPLP